MASPASIKGHPIHGMLVAYPIGLWTFSLICDVIYRALRLGGNESALPVLLSLLGVVAIGVSGWLGGELVYVHGVGVAGSPRSPSGSTGP